MWSFGTTMTIADDQDRQHPPAPPAKAPAQDPPPTDNAQPVAKPVSTRPDTRTPIFSQRSLSQLGLFAAGAGFLTLSTFITRRAIARKHFSAIPLFFEQSNRPSSKLGADGGLVAVEALGLATLNTIGFGILATGGCSWAFDISDVEELRQAARKHTRAGLGDSDEAAEQEIAQYFNDILAGKDQKEGATTLEKAFGTLIRQKEQKDGNDQQADTKPPASNAS